MQTMEYPGDQYGGELKGKKALIRLNPNRPVEVLAQFTDVGMRSPDEIAGSTLEPTGAERLMFGWRIFPAADFKDCADG